MSLLDQVKSLVGDQFQKTNEGTSVLGVDVGTSSIKIVQLRNEQGTALLETYGEIALGPLGGGAVGESVHVPSEVIAQALKNLMKESSVKTTRCGVSVPFASSLVKLIEVPPLDVKKLSTVIPLEARKYVPVPINEVQLDWFVVPETEQRLFEGMTKESEEAQQLDKRMVLIVAMHNQLLQKHAETMKLAGLNPLFYEIEVFSNVRATVARSLAPVAVIDIGAATSKLYVVELGIILASHVVQKGSQDITRALANTTHTSVEKAEEMKRQTGILSGVSQDDVAQVSHAATLAMEQVFAEVRRVLVGFQRKYNKVITKVILTGGGAALKGIDDFARQQLELETEIAHPFEQVQAPEYLDEVLREQSPDFAVAVGLALRALHENK
jgi:type IV pilus assembly protein PilM